MVSLLMIKTTNVQQGVAKVVTAPLSQSGYGQCDRSPFWCVALKRFKMCDRIVIGQLHRASLFIAVI